MNRKILSIALPLVGAAVLVGSGFSAWYFGDVQTVTSVGTVEVTPTVDGVLSVKDSITSFKVVLDQGGIVNATNRDKGISITKTDGTALSEIAGVYTMSTDQASAFAISNLKVTLHADVTLSGGAETYLEVKTEAVASDVTFTSYTEAVEIAVNTSTTDKVNSLLQFKENQKPQNVNDYETMKTALANAQITVSFTATVEDVA